MTASVLDRRVALVTGSGRGIGAGIATALARAGASVAVVDRDRDSAASSAAAIVHEGGTAFPLACDVSDPTQVAATIAAVVDRFGSLSVLVNNAQALRAEVKLVDHTIEDVELAMNSGFWGTFHCMQAAFPHLRNDGDGRVVNLGSSAGTHGMAGLGAYAATKEAIRGLSRVAAREWGEFGITVNVICPSSASPAMLAWANDHPDLYESALAQRPIRRDGDPVQDIGPLVVFLAGHDSGFVTGETIMVNGGSALRP
jgi:NAD(P)-dependent dehydrogenase (short-subunit alcohol dehydrogenase family)